MDWDRVEGNWKQIKGKVKEQWGDLTDDELDEIAGKRRRRRLVQPPNMVAGSLCSVRKPAPVRASAI